MKKATFFSEFMYGVKQGPRLFFAPLIGAINGIRSEWHRVDVEDEARRREQELDQELEQEKKRVDR